MVSRKKVYSVVSLFAVLTLCSCMTPTGGAQKSNLTFGMVKKHIIKGQTIQAEVLQLLGGPNIITKDRQNLEVWTYEQVAYEASSVSGGIFGGGAGFGPTGGGGGIGGISGTSSTSGSRTATLIIKFDDNDVVKDYSMMVTKF